MDPLRAAELAETQRVIDSLERSQWKSSSELLTQQLIRLQQLLAHSKNTVPCYQEKYSSVDLSQQLSIDQWHKLPVLTRAQANQATDKLHTTLIEQIPFTYPLHTSGSTGTPLHLLGTIETLVYWRALAIRNYQWHSRDFTKRYAKIKWDNNDHSMGDGSQVDYWSDATQGFIATGPSLHLNVKMALEDQVKWLARKKPAYFLSYPSQIQLLAEFCIDQGITITSIEQVETVGEMVNDELATLVDKAWGAKLINIYSSEEFGYIAIQCPEYNHLHVNAESVFLELLDENNQPASPGEIGKVVISHLHNFATPLLRYEIGDYAQFGEPCPCGRDALPVLKKVHGRARNRLVLADGSTQFAYTSERGQRRAISDQIKQYQYVQVDLNTIEVKLVVPKKLNNEQECRFADYIRETFNQPLQVYFTYHDDIPRSSNGKFEEFISLVDQSSHASV